MASFNDLGLREELASALEELGIERPTALQQALVPVLRREGNVVARAGSGSGKTLAYGLGILDRLHAREPDESDEPGASGGTRLLVLTPTAERAESTALTLVPLAHAAGLTVAAAARGWGTGAAEAEVLVATPAEIMQSVRASGVKLEGLEAVVVDGASEVEALGGWEALETLFDHVPRDAQRVLVTAETTPGVDDLVDRRIKRALRFPPTAAVPGAPTAVTGVVGYVIVTDREKLEVVARVLGGERGDEAAPAVVCSTDEKAAHVAEALALRGFVAGDLDEDGVDVAVVGLATALQERDDDEPARSTVISFDVPPDEVSLRALHGGEITGFILLLPRELPHLRQVAERAGLEARPAGLTGEAPIGGGDVRTFRDLLRRALREEDLGAQMLVLEPLFEDFTPAEVAAAATALLRRRPPVAAQPAAGEPVAVRPQRPAPPQESTAGTAPSAYARLYVGVGERDGVRAGDLVGAIAGESDIPGSNVGRIEIRDTFSIVEVPAELAEHIIASVNGTTIKGRAARVDHDRGNMKRGPGGPRPAGGRTGPGGRPGGDRPRRTQRPPPRDRE